MECVTAPGRCGHCTVTVAWQLAGGLVARRRCVLRGGVCHVSCRDTPQLLAELFRGLVERGVLDAALWKQEEHLQHLHPDLMQELDRIVASFLARQHPSSHRVSGHHLSPLMASSVSTSSRDFPPCMARLQRHLTAARRLQHHQRYRYTLFLKDVGVPLDQNILFWSQHYSAAGQHSSCSHTWHQNASRYTYSIRHMYGLEGGRLERQSHQCQQLQSMTPQPGDCGGCPFALVDGGTSGTKLGSAVAGHSNRARSYATDVTDNNTRHHESHSHVSHNSSLKRKLSTNGIEHQSKLIRCNSFPVDSDSISSSQTILMDINNSITKVDFFRNSRVECDQPNRQNNRCSNSTTSPSLLGRHKPSSVSLSQRNNTPNSSPVPHNTPPCSQPSSNLELRRLLAVCGVPSGRHDDIIDVAVQNKPTLACRMTLAAILDDRHRQEVLLADGCSVVADGCTVVADGCTVVADGCSVVADGCSVVADGCSVVADGCSVVADGCSVVADGCTVVADGVQSDASYRTKDDDKSIRLPLAREGGGNCCQNNPVKETNLVPENSIINKKENLITALLSTPTSNNLNNNKDNVSATFTSSTIKALDCYNIENTHSKQSAPSTATLSRSVTWNCKMQATPKGSASRDDQVRKLLCRTRSVHEPSAAANNIIASDPSRAFGIKRSRVGDTFKKGTKNKLAIKSKRNEKENDSHAHQTVKSKQAMLQSKNIKENLLSRTQQEYLEKELEKCEVEIHSKSKEIHDQCCMNAKNPVNLLKGSLKSIAVSESCIISIATSTGSVQSYKSKKHWISWADKAIDPNDISLNFTSPLQYYQLLQQHSSSAAVLPTAESD